MSDARDQVQQVLQKVLEPLIRADQGELYLVRAEEGLVTLHLGGRFSGCPGNTLVARRLIEPLVATALPKARVEVTSGCIVPEGAQLLQPTA